MFFETPTANVGFAEPEVKATPSTFGQNFSAQFDVGFYIDHQFAYYNALEQAYEKRIKAIKQAIPGVTLINPSLLQLQRYQTLEDGIDREEVDPYEQFKLHLRKLADENPHLKDIIRPDEDPRSSAALFQREVNRKATELGARYKGLYRDPLLEKVFGYDQISPASLLYQAANSSWLPGILGGFTAMATDPVNWAASAVGISGPARTGLRGLLTMAAKQAALNAAVEAALQPTIQYNRALAGVDYGAGQAALNVAAAGLFGGAIDLAGRGAYRAITGATGVDPVPAAPRGATPSDRPPPIEPAPTPEPPRAPDIPPELIERVEKGDLEAAREVIRRSGAEDDPEIQAIEYAITVEDRTQKQIDALVGERIEVEGVTSLDRGDLELRMANAIRAATDDVEPPRVGDTAPATSRVPSIADDDALRAAAKRINKGLDQVTIDGRPAALRQLEAKSLTTDPERFMARGGDTSGVTRWDPESAGRLVVFEGKDGRLIVADGQKRLELAQRLTQDGQDVPPVETIVFREADGWSAREVDDIAIRRSVEESADAMEIARAIRRSPDIVDGRMPLDTDVMQTARGLARLSDEAFAAVEDGTVARHVGAAVGDHVADRAAHRQMLDDLAAAQPNSPAEARMILREMLADHPDNRSRAQEITLGTHHGDAVFAATHGRFRARLFGDLMQGVDADPELRAMLLKEARALDMGPAPRIDTPEQQAAVDAVRVALLMERTLVPGSRGAGVLDDAARALAQGFDPDDVRGSMLGRMSKILREDGVAGLARPVGEQRVPGGPGDEVFFAIRAYHGTAADEPFGGLVPRRTDFARPAAEASGQRARLPYDTTRTLYTEAAADIMPELRQEIMAVTRMLPENVRIEVQDRIVMPIDGGGRAVLDGYFDPVDSIIRVALDSADPRGTVNHEAIHAIKKAGLFTESEWQQIVGYARRNNLRDKFEIDARYGDAYRRMFPDPNRFEEAMIEEVVAHAFAAWRAGERFGSKIDRVIDRIVQFLNRVADVLGMRGFRRADDVFRSIESGEIAGRGASALAPDRTLFSFRHLLRAEPNPGVYDLADLPPQQRIMIDNHRMTYAAKKATELHGASERNFRIDAVRDLNAGIPVAVSPDAVNVIRTSLEQFADLLPQGVRFGAVGSITPLDGPGKLVQVGVIRDLSRGSQAATDSIVLPRDVLINSQAIVSRDGRAVLLFNLSGGENLGHAFRGQVAKVLAESALVRGEIPEGLISRFVRHVRDESPLEKTLGRYASERGDMLDPTIAERTLREYYTLRYKDDPQLEQILQAKSIGHLVEDYAAGRMPEDAARYLRAEMEELVPGMRQQKPEADSLQVVPADEAHVRRELTQIERLGDMKDVVEACRR